MSILSFSHCGIVKDEEYTRLRTRNCTDFKIFVNFRSWGKKEGILAFSLIKLNKFKGNKDTHAYDYT